MKEMVKQRIGISISDLVVVIDSELLLVRMIVQNEPKVCFINSPNSRWLFRLQSNKIVK